MKTEDRELTEEEIKRVAGYTRNGVGSFADFYDRHHVNPKDGSEIPIGILRKMYAVSGYFKGGIDV